MDPAVWFSRGRQAVSQWLDRSAKPWRRGTAAWHPFHEVGRGSLLNDMEQFLRSGDEWGAAATLRRHYAERFPARFFAGVGETAMPASLTERLSEERALILAQADAVCGGRFDLLGYRGLTFGDPVDWHLDPVARRRVPLLHWSRIDPFDVALCGDSRIIWHVNRHQWLVLLGEAYRLTGERRYADRFDETIRDWIRVNPVGMGINWTSSREVAYRLIAWCWALALFWSAPVMTADFLTLLIDELRLHAVHLERYLSYGPQPNWPLTIEALALFYAGCLFPELRRGEQWRRKGLVLFDKQLMREIAPDGRCGVPSTAHHRRILEASLHFLLLADRHAVPVAPAIRDRVCALLDAMLPLRRPDGMLMQVGEPDADWVLPLLPRRRDDWRGLFAVAAALFGNGHYAWAAGAATTEVAWCLGSKGVAAFDRLAPTPPDTLPSVESIRGGYVQMRNGWGRESHQLLLEMGSEGREGMPGDALGIQCTAFGEPVVADPDIAGPASHREWQQFLHSTRTHSSLFVDGVAPGAANAPRRMNAAPRSRAVLRQWCRNERFELADADHDGYRALPHPVVHRRRVLFVKQAYWVLIDDLQGAGRHRLDLVFQLCAERVDLERDLWAKVWTDRGPGLAVKPFAAIALRGDVKEGVGVVAADASVRRAAKTLCYSAEGEVPIRLATLLFPLRNAQTALPTVAPFFDEHGRLSGLTIDEPSATILYSDHSVTVEAA
jgi:hypothetical protein